MDLAFDKHSLVELFDQQALKHAQKTAVSYGSKVITYSELKHKSEQLAYCIYQRLLKTQQMEPIIAILLDRDINLVIAMLAVFKARAAYLLLDQNYPMLRVRHCIEDSNVKLIISHTNLINKFNLSNYPYLNLDELATPNPDDKINLSPCSSELAYVVYTSGSTGTPKGICIEHGSLNNVVLDFQHRLDLSPAKKWLSITAAGFDIFALEIWAPLVSGAECVLYEKNALYDPEHLKQKMISLQPDIMQATPALWNLLINTNLPYFAHTTVLCGGEALRTELSTQLQRTFYKVFNVYGPSETTIWSTCEKLNDDDEPSIGEPISNTSCYVLNDKLNQVQPGEIGMLYIGGKGLARNYLNASSHNKKAFIIWGNTQERLYMTGDLVKYLPSKKFMYVGRCDQQIKLNGHRIELTEIEAVASRITEIAQCCILLNCDTEPNFLELFYVCKQDGTIEPAIIKQKLAEQLPHYMQPHKFYQLNAFPINEHGKINRKQLEKHRISVIETELNITSTDLNQLEIKVANIWKEVLKVDKIEHHITFIELGGNSIHMPQIVYKINQQLDTAITIRHFMENQNIKKLCEKISSLKNS